MAASRSADAGVVRAVCLNCNVGQIGCVEETLAWNPDVVLLQESPGKESLERIASTLLGEDAGVVYGGDVSILVNGTVLNRTAQVEEHFVGARVELQNGMTIELVSTRLSPPPSRLHFWTSDFWGEHRDIRQRHRREVDAIRLSLKRLPADSLALVGGDFNMPPDDAALKPLAEELSDVFRRAGHGWGNTATNEYPLFRVDQIWVSSSLRPDAVVAVRTKYSDHRMVVCDLHVQE